ncbi:NADP(H)-dependent aldo-keto reductase [Aquabacterium sp.]|uniref:NADP(H)-dependent aldo-keto reductase n=1 Tax=Aquabacterium sp. TaxID=1872578 RepID=UPI0024885F3B|nr:NADP(H)-dependent aldo-keto reductase [Aquabacterium sp.]MDI1258851.1 NADP(H)-dependent aldo-keto reductase [Aquabacterium sp.]
MKYRELGRTGLKVSLIALGTMTWGEQNTEAQAHEQLDVALDSGINLIDTAEMYPVPPKPQTQGLTEQYIGTWLKRTGRRADIVLATKAAGPSHQAARPSHIRGGRLNFNRENLFEAVNDSLKRLQTDHIDLYQLHWPDRPTNIFGQRNYQHIKDAVTVPILESLEALQDLVKAGKIRHFGVSNESPWGLGKFVHHAETRDLPRAVSIQNAYSLVNRSFETGLSEMSLREDVGLLAYSPLAFGVLSGKYLNGQRPAGARLTLFDRFTRYQSENTGLATQAYVDLFKQHGIDPAQGALAFVNSRDFVTSNIIGATTLEQLRSNIASVALDLSASVLDGINAIHDRYPNPAP